jgi:eukaryotic-like serine/threonine-protein kinase
MPFQPGQLAGDYEVLDVLGKGGMGSVYRVRNVISDRIEAMKVLLEDISSEPGVVDRFIAEIRTLARLDHPNIAKLHTAFKVKNQLVMVMEFVEGIDLAARAKEGSIPVYKVLGYMKQVLSALGYAHKQGVIHRDIKPSNMMITPQGSIKLMDFGIAKSNAEPLLTKPGTTMGSLLYMSPEQVRGTPVDPRSDIYSLGIVLYELTAGRCPFDSDSTYRIMDAQLNTTPQAPVELNPSLPKPLNDIILTSLQKDPAKRFQNVDAFRRALDSIAPEGVDQTRLISETESFHQPVAAVAEAAAVAPGPAPIPAFAPTADPSPASPFQAAAQPNKPAGRRTLWMALGAVACLCVLAAGLIALPHFRKTAAASQSSTSGTPAYSNPAPDSSGPIRAASSASDSTMAPLTSGAKVDTASNQADLKELSAALAPKNKPAKTSTREASAKTAPQPRPAPAPVPAPDRAANQTQNTPAPPPGPSDQDLNNGSEALMKMQARADAVTQSLNNLKQQQAAQGLTLRADMLSAETRMNSYLQMAQRALQGRNLDLAQKSMDSAEQDLSKLEKFLGR